LGHKRQHNRKPAPLAYYRDVGADALHIKIVTFGVGAISFDKPSNFFSRSFSSLKEAHSANAFWSWV